MSDDRVIFDTLAEQCKGLSVHAASIPTSARLMSCFVEVVAMFGGGGGNRQFLELPGFDIDIESLVNTNAYLGAESSIRFQYNVLKELKLNLLAVQVCGWPHT